MYSDPEKQQAARPTAMAYPWFVQEDVPQSARPKSKIPSRARGLPLRGAEARAAYAQVANSEVGAAGNNLAEPKSKSVEYH